MQDWVTEIMEQYGYFGVFLMMALENLFPPIPSEIVLPFGGFMTTNSDLQVVGVVTVATAGSILGAIILFGIGTMIDVEKLEKVVDRWGHVLRIKKKDIHRADAWFDRYGYWTVLFCRMIPVVRSLISIPAGMSNMNFPLFLLFTTIGTVIWNVLLITIGVVLGENWEDVLEYMDVYSSAVEAVLGIMFVVFIVWYVRKRKRR